MRSKYRTILAVLVAAAAAVSAAPALAAGAPLVETKPATNITETGATLNGTVNPNGAETKYYFEYGTSVLYGKKTTETSAGAGTTKLAEAAAVTGLVKDTKYHFRLVAIHAGELKARGSDEVFWTGPQPEFTKTSSLSGSIGGGSVWKTDGIEWAYNERGTMSGTVTGSTVEKLTMHFKDGREGSCNNLDGEDLVLSELKGRLGYLSKAKHEVGLMIGEQSYSNLLASCVMRGLGTSAKLRGSLIMPITPVNTKTRDFKLALNNTGLERQEEEFTKFEGEAEAFPLAFEFPVGLRTVGIGGAGVEFTTALETEIKA